jgi:hypothetical protein
VSNPMDEVFGKRPGRPDHPDFWRISEVFLANDGAIESARNDTAREDEWVRRTSSVVDIESVTYMAQQRALRAFGLPGAGSAFGLSPSQGGLSVQDQAKVAALVVDAFVAGAMYQQAGGHQPPDRERPTRRR